MINNFWGTLNTSQIAAKITDHSTNSNLPTVLYQPFLTENATATYAASASVIYSPNSQTVNLSATVISADGPVTGGTETFTILSGSTDVGTPITENVANGAASGTYTIPAGTLGGDYTIQAVFSGTSTLLGSSDSTHTLTISGAATTTAAISATTTYSGASQSVSLSAGVSSAAGTVNEGSVTFTIERGGNPVGSAVSANVSSGSATASYTLPAGKSGGIYTIQAVYNGTADYVTSTDASQSLTIDPAATTSTTASALTAFSSAEQNVPLSTTVTSMAGTVNEGTETFSILLGSTVIGSPVTVNVVDGAADASYGIPGGTALGTYTIQAVYSGTINFLGYTDKSQVLVIAAAAAVVSGEVYDDANGSGTLENGDSGLPGWTVDLTNTATNSVYTTTTTASGLFSFTGVAAGTYTLSEVVQPGFAQTAPASPGTYSVTVASSQTVSNENFGDHPTASIGGEVFNDLNGDGTLESGDPGLSGWTVNLLNSSNTIIGTSTTATGGTYAFTSLQPGTYTVQVVSRSGYVASSAASVTLTDDSGQADTVNFGEFPTVAVSGEVFNDANDSGKFVAGDSGLSGWTVELMQGSQVLQATSGSGGLFSFSDVGPGSWTLEVVPQTGWVATYSPVTIMPTSGTNLSGLDLGEHQVVTVTSTADSGAGSLRAEIGYLDANGGGSIDFAIGTGQQTIDLLSPLPAIAATVTIDGTTQPGYSGTPLVELDGAGGELAATD